MHRNLGVIVPPEEMRPLDANRAVAQGRAFGGAGDDSDVQ
jgi:hypothetical protein